MLPNEPSSKKPKVFVTTSDIDIQTSSNQTTASSKKPKQDKRKLKRGSVEPKKVETISKKIKKEKCDSNENVMRAYAQLLPNIIDELVKSRCFGCMLNLDGCHNVCSDRKSCIEQYFVEAVSLVDEMKVA